MSRSAIPLSWQRLSSVARFLVLAGITPLLVINAWALPALAHCFHFLITIVIRASLLAFLLNDPVE